MTPQWLRNWLRPEATPAPVPKISDVARALSMRRVNRDRNRVIDRANELRSRMGMPLIPRRPE